MNELYYAEMEAALNKAQDEYFKARPGHDSDFNRMLFGAGFERAFEMLWRDPLPGVGTVSHLGKLQAKRSGQVSAMNQVEPVMDTNRGYAQDRPYTVKVNGKTLLGKNLNPRRFKDSIAAAIAGAKEVDRLRAAGPSPRRDPSV